MSRNSDINHNGDHNSPPQWPQQRRRLPLCMRARAVASLWTDAATTRLLQRLRHWL